jgi:hypothetical protein
LGRFESMTGTTLLDGKEGSGRQPDSDDGGLAGWMQRRDVESNRTGARQVLLDLLARQRRARVRLAFAERTLASMSSPYDREFRFIWAAKVRDEKALLAKIDPDVEHWRAKTG